MLKDLVVFCMNYPRPVHTEKEMVMMVVPRDIKDNVLNAIYKEMGMAKKAQGIAFSLPVSDTAGLVEQTQKPTQE